MMCTPMAGSKDAICKKYRRKTQRGRGLMGDPERNTGLSGEGYATRLAQPLDLYRVECAQVGGTLIATPKGGAALTTPEER